MLAQVGQRGAGRGDQGRRLDSLPGGAATASTMNKTLLFSALILIPLTVGCRATSSPSSGTFVEARTASVFAGACHYGAEFTTAGREAVLAWRFDGGPARGAQVVAVVSSPVNLAVPGGDRRSVVYLDGPVDAREEALATLLGRELLGEVVTVQRGASISLDGDLYEVRAGRDVVLSGSLLPDRACCSMPANVWYEPLASEDPGIVGNSYVFQCEVRELDLRFQSAGENDAFVGSFIW